jgi:hypothetical protein
MPTKIFRYRGFSCKSTHANPHKFDLEMFGFIVMFDIENHFPTKYYFGETCFICSLRQIETYFFSLSSTLTWLILWTSELQPGVCGTPGGT